MDPMAGDPTTHHHSVDGGAGIQQNASTSALGPGPSASASASRPYQGSYLTAAAAEQRGPAVGQSSGQQDGVVQFDLFEWYPNYRSCQRYFIVHAQHSEQVQAVAAFVNFALPYQRTPASNFPLHPSSNLAGGTVNTNVSLIPYIRRLVVTGFDAPGVLHGFFGNDWASGVGSLHEQERRNYLFAAKSGGWASVKKEYEISPMETVPFLKPLQAVVSEEIEAAETSWSRWLAMEDWMVGPRAPEGMEQNQQHGTPGHGHAHEDGYHQRGRGGR